MILQVLVDHWGHFIDISMADQGRCMMPKSLRTQAYAESCKQRLSRSEDYHWEHGNAKSDPERCSLPRDTMTHEAVHQPS